MTILPLPEPDARGASLQIAFEDTSGSGAVSASSSTSIDTGADLGAASLVAVGAFFGQQGLDPLGPLAGSTDFLQEAREMGAKHTEVTSVGVDISLTDVSVGGFAFGGSSGDQLSADGSVNHAALFGEGGDDVIDAGASEKNIVFGGDGADLIVSGGHADRLSGGAGADTFTFTGMADHRLAYISDFASGDHVDLTQLDSNPSTPGVDSWTIVSQFDGAAGELELRHHADDDRTVVLLDSDGDGHADHKIVLHGDVSNPDFLVT